MKQKSILSAGIGLILMIALLPGCYYENGPGNRIEASGPVIKRVLDLENFDGIILANSADVFITQGSKQKVEVEGQENILRNLSTDVSGGVWKIRNKRPVWRRYNLTVRITMTELDLVRLSGSGNINSTNTFEDLNDLDLIVSGSGNIKFDIEADEVMGRISGSGSINLMGFANRIGLTVTGSGNINAISLKSESATANISGSGGIRLHASEDLDARVSGSGNIVYKGNPSLDSRVTGSGSIHSR